MVPFRRSFQHSVPEGRSLPFGVRCRLAAATEPLRAVLDDHRGNVAREELVMITVALAVANLAAATMALLSL